MCFSEKSIVYFKGLIHPSLPLKKEGMTKKQQLYPSGLKVDLTIWALCNTIMT